MAYLDEHIVKSAESLLDASSTGYGFTASIQDVTNYRAVFARDGIMSGLCSILYGKESWIKEFIKSLACFRDLQGPQGQIASNFRMDGDKIVHISYGTLSAKTDACTWYLIGVGVAARHNLIDPKEYLDSVIKVVDLLAVFEYNGRHLMYVPKGGNWADEYIYDGYILYDQWLRYWALSLVGEIFDRTDWQLKSRQILGTIFQNYRTGQDPELAYHPRAYRDVAALDFPYLLSTFSPTGYFNRFDLPANVLWAILAPPEESVSIGLMFDWIDDTFLSKHILPPAFYPAIDEQDPYWNELSSYHLFEFKNLPHHYHNGGVWPIWIGWLSLAAAKHGRSGIREKLGFILNKSIVSAPSFNMHEYKHGQFDEWYGTELLIFTATGLLLTQLESGKIDFSLFGLKG